jgi:hypothetical protein
MSLTAEEILAKAADLVEQGWCQEHLTERDAAGQVVALCIGGALLVADGADRNNPVTHHFSWAGQEALAACEAEAGDFVPHYNDAPGRTLEEVATLCRNAKRHLVAR